MEQRKKILIAEDDVGSLKLLVIVLGRAGYDVVEATTGPAAVKLARASQPALIIMDIELPEMRGDKVTEQIKADASMRHIPVLVMTVYDRDCRSCSML
jgi:CheY-like chemotaxis protein